MNSACLALGLAALLAQAAHPPVPAAADAPLPKAACIRPGDIANHAMSKDRKSVFILVSGKGVYRLDVRGACLQGAMRSDPMVFRAIGGSSRACRPADMLVGVRKGAGLRPCSVDAIAKLTPDEAKALPKGERP
jgi:hypothetical protein